MRILIDVQGMQSESRFRGIGRYSRNFLLEFITAASGHEISLLVNGQFFGSIPDIRAEFGAFIPEHRIHIFHSVGRTAEFAEENLPRSEVARRIRQQLVQELAPDVLLVTSHFEGFVDDSVTGALNFNSSVQTAVICYDLIPFIYSDKYLKDPRHRTYYFRKLQTFMNYDLFLCISQSTQTETINCLGVANDRTVNVSAASESVFQKITIGDDRRTELYRRYGISGRFVMYAPGGFDDRKNFSFLIKAYSELPKSVRQTCQLVIVSKVDAGQRELLEQFRSKWGLEKKELVISGWVEEEDLVSLYNLSDLFVFPSLHEGFGLPVLEAMSCGCPTLAADTTSLPEVVGDQELLFGLDTTKELHAKMLRALTDEKYVEYLRKLGSTAAARFSWEMTARKALSAIEKRFGSASGALSQRALRTPRLAYLSPLPPSRSGISDYSELLLPHLARYYSIDLIVQSPIEESSFLEANFPCRTLEYFREKYSTYDRVLYHFGNSPLHQHMFELVRVFPGVIVLHDFYLSSVLQYMEVSGYSPGVWQNAAYLNHGYFAAEEARKEPDQAKERYPMSLEVIKASLGTIVHSAYSFDLSAYWYGDWCARSWKLVPLARNRPKHSKRGASRLRLGISEETFLVCSFGFIAPTKLSLEMLQAWDASALSKGRDALLVLVGENDGGDYGKEVAASIRRMSNVRILGWASADQYADYLSSADLGIQLRTKSRGETSAAVLDCMSYGIATIVNANGSFGYLPNDCVKKLPDTFAIETLADAIDQLWRDNEQRERLGIRAASEIASKHSPDYCAGLYYSAIESAYASPRANRDSIPYEILRDRSTWSAESLICDTALGLYKNISGAESGPVLYFDVTSISNIDLRTGIERVVREQLVGALKFCPRGWRIEAVRMDRRNGVPIYLYARSFMKRLLELDSLAAEDEEVAFKYGDILYAADFARDAVIEAGMAGVWARLKAYGVKVAFLVYDLLPVESPQFFPPFETGEMHARWLKTIGEWGDVLISISETTRGSLEKWLAGNGFDSERTRERLHSIHLGANIQHSVANSGRANVSDPRVGRLKGQLNFVVVGTIEPRKGHAQIIDAFEQIWKRGIEVNLVVVGREGWRGLDNSDRRTIPSIVNKLVSSSESGKRLVWFDDADDHLLDQIYREASCLIFASEGEGFGLPLVEAAIRDVPIVARDITVFREVADGFACFFGTNGNEDLANTLIRWINDNESGHVIKSSEMPFLTWEDNVLRTLEVLGVN